MMFLLPMFFLVQNSFATSMSVNDVRQFCIDTEKSGYTPDDVQGMLAPNANPWVNSQYPELNIKLNGYTEKLRYFRGTYSSSDGTEQEYSTYGSLDYIVLGTTTSVLPPMTNEEVEEKVRKNLTNPSLSLRVRQGDPVASENNSSGATGSQQTAIKNQSTLEFGLICAKYTLGSAKACMNSMSGILSTMFPSEANYASRGVMARPVVDKVLNNPDYISGATNAALTIIDRVKNKDMIGDIFSDIKNGYLKAGKSNVVAEGYTWDLIATWATRGPNISVFLDLASIEKSFNPYSETLLALDLISSAAPYLDQLRIDAGKSPYSYPPGTTTTCSYGKSYHFWMTAFLSREFGIENKSPGGAMYAAYISELGYQMRSNTTGRDETRAFTVDAFDPANNKLRIDIAFASAGAVYGMESAAGKKVSPKNIDMALVNMANDSSPQPLLDHDAAEEEWNGTGLSGYNRWMKIFSPDSALNTFL